jgi:hypothetical protein
MTLEVVPPLSEDEDAALRRGLATLGGRLDGRPESYRSAWRRTALREATDNEPVPRYALSPRSTRGATRA